MDIDKLTMKVQQAINNAQSIAISYNHQQIDVIHLFSALVFEENGLIPNIFGIKPFSSNTNAENK